MVICFPSEPGFGGPGSFQVKFENELQKNGHKVCYAYENLKADAIVIVGGTRKIKWLIKNKLKGVPIIYRLDGINWLHRVRGANQRSLSNWLRSEKINFLFKFLHAFIANYIVYQSEFVKNWWDKAGWKSVEKFSIIHNGIDLSEFTLANFIEKPTVICLEGYLDYTPFAIDMINDLAQRFGKMGISFKVYGRIKSDYERKKLSENVDFCGSLSLEELPSVYKNSIYISLDINAACPNTVVEALGCGAPVVGFDTGALKELIKEQGGKVVHYGSDQWKVKYPGVEEITETVRNIYDNYSNFSYSARILAETEYSIETMVHKYIDVLEGCINRG